MDDLRHANRRLAAAYDALAFETAASPGLQPRALLGFGGVFGCAGALGDVLDLGCGGGVQLEDAARQTTGRLVGVEMSGEQCRRAQARLAPFAGRAQIHQADLMDLTPQALGQFDVIYAIGLVYAVPQPVRAHLLSLIGACLKPGGVALISHYGGAVHAARAEVHAKVRAEVEDGVAPGTAIAQGRAALARLAQSADIAPLLRDAARLSDTLPDSAFFHEVFNPFVAAVTAGELDQALAKDDVRFLAHLESPASAEAMQPQARAQEADARDRQGGGYHYALFGKTPVRPDIAAPDIVWSTPLRQQGNGSMYRVGERGNVIQITHGATRAALNAIALEPRHFLAAAPDQERDVTYRLFCDLWRHKLVVPLREI